MHGPGLWRYEQKEQRAVPMSRVNCDLWCPCGAAKILELGWSKTQDTPPDQGTNMEYNPLLEGQPVEYNSHKHNSCKRFSRRSVRENCGQNIEILVKWCVKV